MDGHISNYSKRTKVVCTYPYLTKEYCQRTIQLTNNTKHCWHNKLLA